MTRRPRPRCSPVALLAAAMLCAAPLRAVPAVADTTAADSPPSQVGIVYPRVREPFRAVFRAIADGILLEIPRGTQVFEVDPEESAESISGRLAGERIDAVVLLGNRGLDLSRKIQQPQRRVVGAVFAKPDEISSGVQVTSMAPAPSRLFEKLRELAPGVKRIHVIYGADSNEWLIDRARGDAQALGYELIPVRRESIKEGASAYRELLKELKSPIDAMWLLQASPFLDESSLLQMILRAAWDQNLVVFSSNPSHVPKGALFALFPDNREMGRHLAKQISRTSAASGPLAPLEQLDTAINIRTADHLGLGLTAGDARFDMVFPSR